MGILELLKKKKEEIKKELEERTKDETEHATQKIDNYVKNLKEASKIVLPVNLLEILEQDGKVEVFILEDKSLFRCEVNDETLCRYDLSYTSKYRVVLIFERMLEEEK